jgi:hypothetical protein
LGEIISGCDSKGRFLSKLILSKYVMEADKPSPSPADKLLINNVESFLKRPAVPSPTGYAIANQAVVAEIE